MTRLQITRYTYDARGNLASVILPGIINPRERPFDRADS